MRTLLLLPLLITVLSACSLRSGKDADDNSAPRQYLIDGQADVMLFDDRGDWPDESNSLRKILFEHGVSYKVVTAQDLNDMHVEDMIKAKLLIMPGGDSDLISASLYTETGIALREAVQEHGMSFLGFCAGAWLAVAPKPQPGMDPVYGLGLIDGALLKHTYLEKQGLTFATPVITFADGTKRRQLWYGGPITPEVSGGVFARFEDGTPAITQVLSGKGLVTISGIHPTANKTILKKISAYVKQAIAPDLTWKLIDSGINKKHLPAF